MSKSWIIFLIYFQIKKYIFVKICKMLSSQIYIFRGTPGWNVEATRAHRSAGPRESNQLNQTKPTQTKPNQPIPSRLVALNRPPSHSSTLCVCFYRHHCSIAVCRGLYFTVHQKLYSLTPFLGEKKIPPRRKKITCARVYK